MKVVVEVIASFGFVLAEKKTATMIMRYSNMKADVVDVEAAGDS